MAQISVRNVTKVYKGDVKAVDNVNLGIENKEFMVLVGPSGCGKSTTLRMIAGLEEITEGKIWIGDRLVNDVPAKDRDIAMVFQNYALYPHMTVFENMAFGLKLRKYPKHEIVRRVQEATEILGIKHLLDRRPKQLSGGERQRVALGRAIVRKPQVFLFDEPLSNLDAKLRVQMRTEIHKLRLRLQTTFVYVTHDQTEAMTMGDRVCVLKDGVLQQVGSPRDLYDNPTNVFVAGFIGSPAMNLLELPIVDGGAEIGGRTGQPKTIPLERSIVDAARAGGATTVTVGFRPEDLHLADETDGWAIEVDVVESLGADAYVYGHIDGPEGTSKDVIIRTDGRKPPMKGDRVYCGLRADHQHVFHAVTGARLGGQ